MNEHALCLVSIYACEIGWILFGAIFIFRKRSSRDKTRKRDWISVIGIALQMSSLPAVWMMPRQHCQPLLALGFWFQFVTATLVVAIVIVSLWTMWSAIRVLGKQWSLQASVLEDHRLIREGHYRFGR